MKKSKMKIVYKGNRWIDEDLLVNRWGMSSWVSCTDILSASYEKHFGHDCKLSKVIDGFSTCCISEDDMTNDDVGDEPKKCGLVRFIHLNTIRIFLRLLETETIGQYILA